MPRGKSEEGHDQRPAAGARSESSSAPGWSSEGVYRPGGPHALVTNLCLFMFEKARRRFRLESLHPGVTLEEVRDNTGFDFDAPDSPPETAAPDAAMLELLRTTVAQKIADPYPKFATRVWGAKAAA